ncbi:hypothetical protein VCRA2121O436_440014 [Vibrio crassostreae]|nr:hypothetical protein VCRA2113O420_450007 [Vibrio crassostreae]CAK3484937.1 hypothetical protein VCRA2121O436_440014 [Vibrio crassostreae]
MRNELSSHAINLMHLNVKPKLIIYNLYRFQVEILHYQYILPLPTSFPE